MKVVLLIKKVYKQRVVSIQYNMGSYSKCSSKQQGHYCSCSCSSYCCCKQQYHYFQIQTQEQPFSYTITTVAAGINTQKIGWQLLVVPNLRFKAKLSESSKFDSRLVHFGLYDDWSSSNILTSNIHNNWVLNHDL